MGCDIHAYAEIKRSFGNEEEAWYCCENFQLSPYHIWAKKQGKEVEIDYKYETNNLYRGRNYGLFEALAGVRGLEENCLFDFKGTIPKDCSDFVRSEWEDGEADWHSPSYITIKELFEVEDSYGVSVKGYITQADADKLDTIPSYVPEHWVAESYGCFTEYRTFTFKREPLKEFKKAYFESFKREMYYMYCSDERVLEAIEGEQGDKYRIVFWFDN